MAFTTRRQSEVLQLTSQAEVLPEYIIGETLELYYEQLPSYVQKMSTPDLVARANDMFHDDGVLSTWERGTTDPRTGKVVYGSLEAHAAKFAELKGYKSPGERDELVNRGFYNFVLPYVDERVQKTVQGTLRDRLIGITASHETDEVFAAFLAHIADYAPRNLEHARKLSEDIFVHYMSLKPNRLAPIVPERTFAAFAAIGRNNNRADCTIPGSNSGIKVTVTQAKVGMLQAAYVRDIRAAGTLGRTPDLSALEKKYAPLYNQLGYEAPATQKTVVPTNARLVVGVTRDSLTTIGRASEAAAKVAKDRVDLAPQKMLGVTTAGVIGFTSLINAPAVQAAPRVESNATLQVPEIKTLDLTGTTEMVSASSALPAAFVESALTKPESQEAIANQALRSEINRLVKQSRESKGFWSQWETVDADELYDAIIREEKRHPHSVVNRFLVLTQLKQESFLKINAVSSAGARGLTQFMPGTWRTWGHGKSPFDPAAAVRAQFEYDIALYNQAHKRFPHMNETQLTRLMLAGYNAGPNNSYVKHGNVPPKSFAHGQTYNYVKIITKNMASMKDRLPSVGGHVARPKSTVPKVVAKAKELFTPSASLLGMMNDTVAEGDSSPIQLGGPAETSESELNPVMLDSMLGRLGVETTVEPQNDAPVHASASSIGRIAASAGDNTPHSQAASAIPASFIANLNSNPDIIEEAAPPVEALATAGTPAPVEAPTIAAPAAPVIPPENRDVANTPLPDSETPAPLATPQITTPAAPATPAVPVEANTGSQPSTSDLMAAFVAVDQKAAPIEAAPISINLASGTDTKPQMVEVSLAPAKPADSKPEIAPAPLITPGSNTQAGEGIKDILPPSITAPAPVAPPKPAEVKKAEAPQPKAEVKPTSVDQRRQAEIARLKQSGDFKKSQALDDAQRSPLEKKLQASGQENGRLKNVERLGKHWKKESLYAPAAEQFRKLDAAYYAEFGHHIVVNDSYRSYARQVATKADAISKGRSQFAATPGHSKHGWGLALDLGGGMQSFHSKEYKWMLKHALDYGFNHPDFADDSSSPEPWHWEYVLSE